MNESKRMWARLIDGEMSFAEQRAMLATLDDTENGWKKLALALLEEQAFRREMLAFTSAEDGMGQKIAMDRSLSKLLSSNPNNRAVKSSWWASSAPFRVHVAIAALMAIVCFGLGMRIEHYRQPTIMIAERTIPPTTSSPSNAVETQQTMKLTFADQNSGAQTVEVPVADAFGAEATELLSQSAVSDELRKKVEAQGYVIHEERKYVLVSLANGQQGIAPVSDVVVEPQPVVFQ